ncbi:MAG: hypothetical protein V3T84_00880 [Phycisphaerales bacterium]
MTMGRRRLMLGIGAALLVGGWGVIRYADFIGGVLSMAVGAGLIGFAVLRPTNHKDE